jgi:beta-ureidopropionase
MRKMICTFIAAISIAAGLLSPALAATPADPTGKPVSVASICVPNQGGPEKNLQEALKHLQSAGEAGVDIACLPEDFLRTGGGSAEPIPGPTTQAVGKLARQYKMYVICPFYELADGRRYNSAVLIGRDGEPVGVYRKVYPYWSEHGITPGQDVAVFETDFGRIAVLICFDINFPPLWDKVDQLGAEIVFWPSAYAGGMPFKAYAILHHYYIITCTQKGDAVFVDITGDIVRRTRDADPRVTIVTLDLDRTLFHENFNGGKIKTLLRENPEKVTLSHYPQEEWYLIEAAAPGVSVRDLAAKYGMETLREYCWRSRRQIDTLREDSQPLK